MTTRVTFSNGEVSEYDEETEVHPSGPGMTVVSREYLGPTPPESQQVPVVSAAERRAQLRAELDALGGNEA